MMTVEEAVQWCIDQEVEVLFYKLSGKPVIVIYDFGDTERNSIGQGATLIEAVQRAKMRES